MSIYDENLQALLEKLSAATPTPGGGSAAALVGSIAASLVVMVAGVTIGKRAYQPVEQEMRQVLAEATTLRDELVELADRDSASFNAVIAAYRLPQETESARAERARAIQSALKGATEAPYQTALRCYRVLELAEIVVTKGNKSALSDGGAAAVLAESAVQAAVLNIAINLPAISDESVKGQYARARQQLAQQAQEKREKVFKTITERLIS